MVSSGVVSCGSGSSYGFTIDANFVYSRGWEIHNLRRTTYVFLNHNILHVITVLAQPIKMSNAVRLRHVFNKENLIFALLIIATFIYDRSRLVLLLLL